VAISATPALVKSFIGPILIRAGYQNWQKRIVLRVHSPEDDLRNGDADIGLQMALPPKAEFQAHAVGRIPLVAIVPEDHPLAQAAVLTCAMIAAHPLVCYNADWSPMGSTIRTAFVAQGLSYEPLRRALLRQCLQHGAGLRWRRDRRCDDGARLRDAGAGLASDQGHARGLYHRLPPPERADARASAGLADCLHRSRNRGLTAFPSCGLVLRRLQQGDVPALLRNGRSLPSPGRRPCNWR